MTEPGAQTEPNCAGQRIDALRDRNNSTDVSTLELFFDLVYVFAVGQISHLLIEDLTWRGALNATVITVAIWWAWIDTAWITNWFDPRKMPVRLMMIALMGVSLVMSAAIPEAFGDRGQWFAIAYVAIQVGRSAFCLFMLGENPQSTNFTRLTFWSLLSAPLWLAGGFAEGDLRLTLWIAAVLLDSVAPALGYPTPRIGRSTSETWEISGGHLAERCQLFVIIALGESVLLTGSTLSNGESPSGAVGFAFGAAFLISVLMWWVYFARAGRAAELFEQAHNPGGMGRAYTYFHMPMVAGIIALAVANEKVIAHPGGRAEGAFVAVLVGGSLLYLFGNAIFNSTITESFPWRRLATGVAIVLMLPFYGLVSPIVLTTWVLVAFLALAVVDHRTTPTRDETINAEL
jgi:low temperature requirement protein LtrA